MERNFWVVFALVMLLLGIYVGTDSSRTHPERPDPVGDEWLLL